jgi:hypothetical protein
MNGSHLVITWYDVSKRQTLYGAVSSLDITKDSCTHTHRETYGRIDIYMRHIQKSQPSIRRLTNVLTRVVLSLVGVGLMTILSSCTWFSTGGFFETSPSPTIEFNQGIAISESISASFNSSKLVTQSTISMTGTTYDDITISDILASQGLNQDENGSYVAYGFYLMNTGAETVFIEVVMRLIEVSYQMDDAIRILIIDESGAHQIFKKAESNAEETIPEQDDLPYTMTVFESQTVIYKDAIVKFMPSQINAFHVVIWVDQDDPDFLDIDQRANMKAVLTFKIAGTNDETTMMPMERKLWITLSNVCNVEFDIGYQDVVDTEDQT